MPLVSVKQLHEDNGDALALAWLAGRDAGTTLERTPATSAALIGHLNLTHPNRIQVAGREEAASLERIAAALLGAAPAAVILADGIPAPAPLVEAAERARTPLLATPLSAGRVIEKLARYLAKVLAERTERHGVFMDVLGLGVLVTGDSGVGKSELGLELISRGHGLVADDIVEISRLSADTLEGRCPALLKDFIEVRGLGLLDVRTIFGETAVRPKMRLRLIAHLDKPAAGGAANATARLPLAELSEEILGVTVRKVIIPVAAGRNLAVLLEAAVRNYILQLRGIDSGATFAARQRRAMDGG